MKNVIALAVLFLAVESMATCRLTLKKKKLTSKTAILDHVTISKKLLTALKANCELTYMQMTQSELIKLEQSKFNAKIKRIKGL